MPLSLFAVIMSDWFEPVSIKQPKPKEQLARDDHNGRGALRSALDLGRCCGTAPEVTAQHELPLGVESCRLLEAKRMAGTALSGNGKRRRAAGREAARAQIEQGFKARGAAVPLAKPRCIRVQLRSSAAKLRRLSRNRRKYSHAPAAAPRCPSRPSATSQACRVAIS